MSCLLQRHYTCSHSHDSVKHGGKARTVTSYQLDSIVTGLKLTASMSRWQKLQDKDMICCTNRGLLKRPRIVGTKFCHVHYVQSSIICSCWGWGVGGGTGDGDQRRTTVGPLSRSTGWFVTSDKIW